MQFHHSQQTANALDTKYPGLTVQVVAEPKPAVRLSTTPQDLQRWLSRAEFVVLVDSKQQVLGGLSLAQFQASQLLEGETLPQDWLAKVYQQDPDRVAIPVMDKKGTVGQALQAFEAASQLFLPLVDAKGRYTGQCATVALLERLATQTLRPARVGGLATPLGVYMTSGYYAAGAGWMGLVATGFLFGTFARLMDLVMLVFYSALITLFPFILRLPGEEQTILQGGFLLVFMLGLLRFTPLSGLHAAEHMTINAIERDLPLTEAVVRTQPREHRRCGTNLLVLLGGAQLIVLSLYLGYTRMSGLGLLMYTVLWVWVVLSFWKPVGLWLQRHFTTKPPTPAQLESGLRAGRELLLKFSQHPHGVPGFWARIWGAGFFQMLLAFMLAFWLMDALLQALGGF